jgi:hypothetical protein
VAHHSFALFHVFYALGRNVWCFIFYKYFRFALICIGKWGDTSYDSFRPLLTKLDADFEDRQGLYEGYKNAKTGKDLAELASIVESLIKRRKEELRQQRESQQRLEGNDEVDVKLTKEESFIARATLRLRLIR